MTRLLLTIAIVGALAAGAAWVVDNPGSVSIAFDGRIVETSFAALALIIAALMLGAALLMKFWYWLRRGIWERRTIARQKRGYDELAWGLSALMAGDGKRARKHARKFERLVGKTPLADALVGEAAMMQGELTEARTRFETLEDNKKTEALALRGLMAVADRTGDRAEVLHSAKVAVARLPKATWAQSGLFEAATNAGQWEDAATAINAAMRDQHLDSAEGRRQLATVRLCQALELKKNSEKVQQKALAKEALDLDPDLIPARILSADLAQKDGKARRAASILKTGWQRNPHPSLAHTWQGLVNDETAAQAYRRLETLTKTNPDHPESLFALAQAAHQAGLEGTARRHLRALIDKEPQKRALDLLVEVGEAAGEATARDTWTPPVTARPDPAWHCIHCGHEEDTWMPRCPECGVFACFTWSTMSIDIKPPLHVTRTNSATAALMAAPVQGKAGAASGSSTGSSRDFSGSSAKPGARPIQE